MLVLVREWVGLLMLMLMLVCVALLMLIVVFVLVVVGLDWAVSFGVVFGEVPQTVDVRMALLIGFGYDEVEELV